MQMAAERHAMKAIENAMKAVRMLMAAERVQYMIFTLRSNIEYPKNTKSGSKSSSSK